MKTASTEKYWIHANLITCQKPGA